jgi:ribosomal protein S18 acetylase RimI-like enzyme
MKFELHSDENAFEAKEILKKLNDFNFKNAGSYNNQTLNVFLKDDTGKLLGGLTGRTYWQWLYIDILIVDDSLRGSGIGSKILKMSEEEAVNRGCRGVHLETHDFQAREFYEKHGYKVVGTIKDLPVGHSKFQMIKSFQ